MKITSILILLLWGTLFQQGFAQNTFWTRTNGPGTAYDVRSLAANSHGHVFAGTWTDGTIWKTTDNGGTWSPCGPVPDPNPVLSISANSHDQLFASVYLKGIFRSTDDGASWQSRITGLTNLAVHTNLIDDSGFVWVATDAGLFRSTNTGDSWTLNRPGGFLLVCLDSTHAVVTDDGVNIHRSSNHGGSWTTTPRAVSVGFGGVHPDGSYYGSTSASAIYRSTDFGATWADMHSGVTWTGYTDAFTFNSRGDIFYARDGFATGILISHDNGQTWNLTNDGLTTLRLLPLFHHPNGLVFVGSNGQGVFRSRFSTDSTAGPAIGVNPGSLDFGFVRGGTSDTLSFQISNISVADTLKIDSLRSTNVQFTVSPGAVLLPPHGVLTIRVAFTPSAAQGDTGTIRISSNDALSPVFRLPVSGRGYGLSHSPIIKEIRLIPYNYNQARVVWFRTIDDSTGAADPVIEYSLWRRLSTVEPWDFIETITAIALDEYALVAPIPYTYTSVLPWYSFMVVAKTRNLQIYKSDPDSIRDPVHVTAVAGTGATGTPGEFFLNQNYPNPFNPSTIIRYGLPRSANVTLIVYNTLGQAVVTLVQGEQGAGYYEVRFEGSNLSSGVYYYRLTAGSYVETKKLLLVR